ncbi:MAG: nucleoside recognition domain-containing protein [Candidatus Zixiibacteriota bacterium]
MIEIGTGLWGLMLKIFLIVMPLIILLEWARSQPWFDRAIQSAIPVFRPMGFRPQALFPLLTGVIFGIAYGAGVLIPQGQSGDLDRRQIFLVGAFLCICHAIIEDTLLFVALGGSGWIILTARFAVAIAVVWLLARLPWPAATPEMSPVSPEGSV